MRLRQRRRPAGTATAAARPADVEVEPGIDQATYDRLLAAGEPDRTARAKAKAAYMRRAKAEARAAQAAGAAEPAPAPAAPAEAAAPTAPGEGPAAPAAEPGSVETPVAAGRARDRAAGALGRWDPRGRRAGGGRARPGRPVA